MHGTFKKSLFSPTSNDFEIIFCISWLFKMMTNFGDLLNTKAIMAFGIHDETWSHFKPVILVEFCYC